jgi:hypothetical protein
LGDFDSAKEFYTCGTNARFFNKIRANQRKDKSNTKKERETDRHVSEEECLEGVVNMWIKKIDHTHTNKQNTYCSTSDPFSFTSLFPLL